MDSINQTLYAIDSINSNELIAEGTTISVYEQWIDKMTFLMEHVESFEDLEIVQEAKSVGTGVTISKGDPLIRRIWDFIRKVVHAIINKISDIATKIKIRNYSYVEIPMEYNDIKADVDDISGIWDGIADLMSHEDTSDIENYDYSKDAAETKKLLDKVNNLRILNVKSNNKRYGVKPEVFMTMRDKLRYLNQQLKDVSKRTDAFIKASEKTDAFKNKSYEQYCRATQQLFAKMHEASTKLFASFKFKNATKTDAEVKIVKKLQQIDNGLNQLREIVKEAVEYGIDDGEWIDETEKPFDEWLKKHNYDSSNNTIMINGKRHDAGKVPSKKERNRMNRFLRENNYDPETETYESDIVDKNGKPERIKLMIVPNTDDYQDLHGKVYRGGELTGEYINLTQNTIRSKPNKSNWTLKHEEGHANQLRGRDSGHIEDAEKMITQNPLDKDTENDHYNSKELDADMYGYQHSRYANKDKPNKTGLEKRYKDDVSSKSFDNEIKHRKERYENNKDFHMKTIKDDIIERAINSLTSDIDFRKRRLSSILSDIEELSALLSKESEQTKQDELQIELVACNRIKERTTKIISKLENKLSRVKNGDYDFKVDEKIDYNTIREDIDAEIAKYLDYITKDISRLERIKDDVKQERVYRNKFLDQHADEAGSKARKLEGRQGKHKGKHK